MRGGLVLARRVELELGEYFADIIDLSTTTVTQLASRAIEFCEKTQNKGFNNGDAHL